VEAGLLTPTLKLKREHITPLFAEAIDALYAAAEDAQKTDRRGDGR
jgi:long-subunit acyl-CoA synthetase (AMP-forming)